MAEISKITLPNGITYDIKDAIARANSGGSSTNAKIDYIGDDNYVYRWNPSTSSYEKTSIYVKGDKGDQGNSGYTGAANELEVVNNLIEGGATKALSAEQGKVLNKNINDVFDDSIVESTYDFDFSESGYVNLDGTIDTTNTNYTHSDFIDISNYADTKFVLTLKTGLYFNYNKNLILFYDENKNLIFYINGHAPTSGIDENYEYFIPQYIGAKIKYFRVNKVSTLGKNYIKFITNKISLLQQKGIVNRTITYKNNAFLAKGITINAAGVIKSSGSNYYSFPIINIKDYDTLTFTNTQSNQFYIPGAFYTIDNESKYNIGNPFSGTYTMLTAPQNIKGTVTVELNAVKTLTDKNIYFIGTNLNSDGNYIFTKNLSKSNSVTSSSSVSYISNEAFGKTMYFFGDSLTRVSGFTPLIRDYLGLKSITEISESGHATRWLRTQILSKADDDALWKADIVGIMIGYNELKETLSEYGDVDKDFPDVTINDFNDTYPYNYSSTNTTITSATLSSRADYWDKLFPKTFVGNLYACIAKLQYMNHSVKIYLVAPHNSKSSSLTSFHFSPTGIRMLRTALFNLGEKMGIDVIDVNGTSGINYLSAPYFLGSYNGIAGNDGGHPKPTTGGKVIGYTIARHIATTYVNYNL